MDRVRLEQLKEKNRAFVRRKTWEGHELFQDCVRSLGNARLIEAIEETRGLIHSMCGRFSFDEYRHIKGARPAAVDELDFGSDQTCTLSGMTLRFPPWRGAEGRFQTEGTICLPWPLTPIFSTAALRKSSTETARAVCGGTLSRAAFCPPPTGCYMRRRPCTD